MSLEQAWLLQYPIAATIAITMSVTLYRRNRGSYAYISFLAYGIIVSAWMVSVYLHRTAETAELTALYFGLSSLFFVSVFPLLLITLLNIIKRSLWSILLLIPNIVEQIVYRTAATPQFVKTNFGWSYLLSFSNQYARLVTYAIYFTNVAVFAIILVLMMTRLRIPKIYRKRYGILFLSFFGLQGIAVIVMQVLLQSNPDMPPIAGFLNLASFLLTTYTLRLSATTIETKPTTEDRERPERAFTFFLERYYSSLSGTELGEAALRFHRFLTSTQLAKFVEETHTGYSINAQTLSTIDWVSILEDLLAFLEKAPDGYKPAQYLGYLLVMTHRQVQGTDKVREFNRAILERHLSFLLRSDLLYDLPLEAFREFVLEDTSLDSIEDWRAAVKLYKRMISQVTTPQLYVDIKEELEKRRNMYNLTRYLHFDPIGKAICDESEIESRIPDGSVDAVVESFNSFTSWIVEHLHTLSEEAGHDSLKRLRDVIKLNQKAALRLRIYAALISSLTPKLSPSRLAYLYLANGDMFGQVNSFSRKFNLSHEQLTGRVVLLEFDPRMSLFQLMVDLAAEARTNGERLVVFTRRKSDLDMSLLEADKYYLTSSGRRSVTSDDRSIPLKDLTSLLGTLISVATDRFACIIFDSVTDLCISLGQDGAYSAMRHMCDVLGEVRAPFILLLNPKAHPAQVVSAFETLSNVILVQDGESLRVLKS